MDTFEHSSRPSPLPTRLRWRPYNSGSSLKAKKAKKDDSSSQEHNHQQEPEQGADAAHNINPKALAHKLRSSPSKPHSSPSVVQLQWEEAETIESMSHGGHPHTQQYYRHERQSQRQSSLSDDGSDTTISSYSQRGSSPFPSPSPSVSPISKLALLGRGDKRFSDLGLLKATVPGITGDDFLNHDLPLPKIEDKTYYQAALNALLENHRRNQILDAQAPALALTNVSAPMSVASPPAKLSDTNMNYPVAPLISGSSSSSKKRLSTSELLGIVNIDDLLASCGYTDEHDTIFTAKATKSTFASPSTTDSSSIRYSPLERSPSPETVTSFTDISAASFDKLMAQTPVLLAQGDSKHLLQLQQEQQQQQQQQQQQHLTISPALSSASTITNSFAEIISDLASPFVRFTSHIDPFIGGDNPSSWPSLFPSTQEEVYSVTNASQQSTSMSTQTESRRCQPSPLLMHLGLSQELDSEWLSFLDDSSPLFSSTDNEPEMEPLTPESPPFPDLHNQTDRFHSNTANTPSTSPSPQTSGFVADWAKGVLQASALSPTGHRGFLSTGSIAPLSSGGNSSRSLIQNLQGVRAQKKSGYHTKTPTQRSTSSSSVAPKNKSQQRKINNTELQPRAKANTPSNAIAMSDKADSKEDKIGTGGVSGLKPDGAWPRATMMIVALQTVCFLVLQSLVLREHILRINQPPIGIALSSPNIIYPILYKLAIVSVCCLCADAMYHRNQIQVVAFTIFNFFCFAYGVIQTTSDWAAIGDAGGPLKALNVAIAVTVGVCAIFLAFATYKLAAVFGWEMYRFLGADIKMRKMHKGYEILITLLKFDVFFFVAFAIQIFTLVDTTDKMVIGTLDGKDFTRQQLLIGLSIPASVILLGLAFFGVMKENRIATIFVMVCLVAVQPYFIYQLVVMYSRPAVSVTMVLVLITLFFMVYCFRNFGKGVLVAAKYRVGGPKRPFEIDEDPLDSEPSIPMEPKQGDDGALQSLMAYPALKKIQEDYHIKPASSRASSEERERSYNNKMEID
ncbi:hypothetical protein BGZ79_003245 [Entomortierella chlamydospora]|nr:hypothetical protein BGZ79_003245 [Entomortierella chlamydospora]